MEFVIDTIDLKEIKELTEYLPISGVTSNPSIVKNTAPADFFAHVRMIRKIIGMERTLHVQVIATEAEEMVKEAYRILSEVDNQVYIKIPVTYEGVKAIKMLKKQRIKITATAVYDLMQAYLALEAGADYIAPYVNRIGNLGADPMDLIQHLADKINREGYDCKILGASYKGVQQVRDSLNHGAHAVTVPAAILKQVCMNQNIYKTVKDFNHDWYSVYGENKGILDL